MKAIPSTKFFQTIVGLGIMGWVMNSICKMPNITPEHYELLVLFMQICGGVIVGSNLFKTVQNIVPINNRNGNGKE